MLALLAALLLSTARAATPEAGVQEDASIAIETPAKVVRHFDGSLRIGYADPLDLGQGSSFMESLAARLEESLRGAGKGGADVSVTLHKYAPFDLQTAVVSHEVDLFLVTSGYYIYLSDMGAGVEWISTLKPPQATDPERAAGSVFVVRADDTRYNQVSDLRTAFVAAAGMASFDGWITALDEVANVSQYPKNFFGKTTFLGASGLSVARAVLERDADVGILRVCELETLTAAGLVEPGSLRVVGEKPQQGLACVSSTELFPGLALAAQTYVPEDVRRRQSTRCPSPSRATVGRSPTTTGTCAASRRSSPMRPRTRRPTPGSRWSRSVTSTRSSSDFSSSPPRCSTACR